MKCERLAESVEVMDSQVHSYGNLTCYLRVRLNF